MENEGQTIDHTMHDIETMLNNELKMNNTSSWNKLDKSTKLGKLQEFVKSYDCDSKMKEQLFLVLKKGLDQNKLQKIKDVSYNIDTQSIQNIPSLSLHDSKFILKSDRKKSTSKSLPIRHKQSVSKKKKYKIDNKDIKED